MWWKSSWGGGLFCHKNQSCSKLPEMDRSSVKNVPSSWGGLICHKNQSCWKLPEMDRSSVKKIPLILGGGLFYHKNQSCSKLPEWIDPVKKFSSSWRGAFCHKNQSCWKLPEIDRSSVKKNFPSSLVGGGGFSATKTKVAGNCLKWIDPV